MIAPTRRQVLAGSGAAFASVGLPLQAVSQSTKSELRIGTVFPASTGLTVLPTSINDYIGDAARQGALVAEAVLGDAAAADNIQLIILTANAPEPEAAARAGRRLVALSGVHALVGGVGDGQAEALSAVAEDAGIPFINVGSPSLELRRRCNRFTFHVEASAAMYLDAMVAWGAAQGYRRWFIISQNDPDGELLRLRAASAIERHGHAGAVVGAASTIPRQPSYGNELDVALNAAADTLLVLLSDVDQIAFVAQQSNMAAPTPPLLFPHPNTQTRDYMAAFRQYASDIRPEVRFALWDATLDAEGARDFNNRYITRWGDPADPPAWSAFHAIKILCEVAKAVGDIGGRAMADYMESSGTQFDLLKGPGTSFRPWDHQLRQPIYIVRVDADAVWNRNLPTTRAAIAQQEGAIPDDFTTDPVTELDRFGDGPGMMGCFEAG